MCCCVRVFPPAIFALRGALPPPRPPALLVPGVTRRVDPRGFARWCRCCVLRQVFFFWFFYEHGVVRTCANVHVRVCARRSLGSSGPDCAGMACCSLGGRTILCVLVFSGHAQQKQQRLSFLFPTILGLEMEPNKIILRTSYTAVSAIPCVNSQNEGTDGEEGK